LSKVVWKHVDTIWEISTEYIAKYQRLDSLKNIFGIAKTRKGALKKAKSLGINVERSREWLNL